MNLTYENFGDIELLSLPGNLVMANADETREEIQGRFENGCKKFVLDLSAVDFVDSSGLSVLVHAFKQANAHTGGVVLLKPSDEVMSLIELTRLHEIFEIFMDQDSAIKRLQ